MVIILSDWIVNGENQKGKKGKWDVKFLKSIGVEFEIVSSKEKQELR